MKPILNMKPINTALLLAMLFAAEVHAQPFSGTLTLPDSEIKTLYFHATPHGRWLQALPEGDSLHITGFMLFPEETVHQVDYKIDGDTVWLSVCGTAQTHLSYAPLYSVDFRVGTYPVNDSCVLVVTEPFVGTYIQNECFRQTTGTRVLTSDQLGSPDEDEWTSFSLCDGKLTLDALWMSNACALRLMDYELRSDTLYIMHRLDHDTVECNGLAWFREHLVLEGFDADSYLIYVFDEGHGYADDRVSCLKDNKYYKSYQVTPTGISVSVQPTAAPYYDLQGRPTSHPTPGIYIQNGRKVMVR